MLLTIIILLSSFPLGADGQANWGTQSPAHRGKTQLKKVRINKSIREGQGGGWYMWAGQYCGDHKLIIAHEIYTLVMQGHHLYFWLQGTIQCHSLYACHSFLSMFQISVVQTWSYLGCMLNARSRSMQNCEKRPK